MLIPLVLLGCACVIIPAICIHALCRNDLHPSIQFLAMLILTPFVHYLILILRLHL